MKNAHRLIVVTDQHAPTDRVAGEVRAALECWPAEARPPLETFSLAQVVDEPALLNEAAVVWCLLEEVGERELFDLLGEVQDRHVPALLTRTDDTRPAGSIHDTGVIVCPPGLDAASAGLMLRSLWSQSPVLRSLQAEMRLLRQQQGGLTGEMDKLDEELRLAAQLQREFLPDKLPTMDPFEFRVLWRPASYVSGDIYDVMRLDEHHMGFFVADAVGHGVPAALLTMFIKRSLHTKVIDPTLPAGYRLVEPSETMAQLNRDLLQHNRGQVRFTTACYGVIDNRTHTITISRGGHPYPMLLRADGSTEAIEPEGPLLGVFDSEPFEQVSVQLAAGDRLLLYSDGFEMAFPGDEPPPNATTAKPVANMQYAREFEDMRHGSLEAALGRLEHKLDTQVGSLNQRDDLTVLCLTMHGSAATDEAEREGGAGEPMPVRRGLKASQSRLRAAATM